MDERVKFIAAYLRGELSISRLCTTFGVSRKTAYKWIARYASGGVAELLDRSRRPQSNPNAMSREVTSLVVSMRKQHPFWGPKKLLAVLGPAYPGLKLPATSTVGHLLSRHGLARPRRSVRRSTPYGQPFLGYDKPNAVWCGDFKGHFRLGDRSRCHPLTISDGFSRFLLRCEGLRKERHDPTRAVFEQAFRKYGLPDAMRTDNGAPFSSLAIGGLSRLSVWWIKLGIRPERIAPGHPEQNGRPERMHRTLKAETAKPARQDLFAQQAAFDLWRKEYSEVRPHEASAASCTSAGASPASSSASRSSMTASGSSTSDRTRSLSSTRQRRGFARSGRRWRRRRSRPSRTWRPRRILMMRADDAKSVTHVSDASCHPCPGLNTSRPGG